MKSYDTSEVAELSGLTAAQVRTIARDKLIGRRLRGRYRFGFQDLVMARTAQRLLRGGVKLSVVRRALRALADVEQEELQSTAVRVRSEGREVVVEDHGKAFNVESGQGMLDFSVGGVAERLAPKVIDLKSARVDEVTADEWYDVGCDLESSNMIEQARAAYERSLEAAPSHADAHVNLGRLDALDGKTKLAEKHYRQALQAVPEHALAWYNLGVLLEDSKQPADAIDAYKAAVAADPDLAEAHYNLAMLLEASDRNSAFRHLSAYKRLRSTRG
ncbi:MAG: tetratricopeptide repeat protein [Woeseiaceae bacterium]|nr:tetratricopeptide repeat protein [Woeseiaceae bacterium]